MLRKKEMIEALKQFKDAYENLKAEMLTADSYEINDTMAITLYPFHKSFDELNVSAWVDATVREIDNNTSMAVLLENVLDVMFSLELLNHETMTAEDEYNVKLARTTIKILQRHANELDQITIND